MRFVGDGSGNDDDGDGDGDIESNPMMVQAQD